MHFAIQNGHTKVAALLLNRGSDITAQDYVSSHESVCALCYALSFLLYIKKGNSALDFAIKSQSQEMIALLLTRLAHLYYNLIEVQTNCLSHFLLFFYLIL